MILIIGCLNLPEYLAILHGIVKLVTLFFHFRLVAYRESQSQSFNLIFCKYFLSIINSIRNFDNPHNLDKKIQKISYYFCLHNFKFQFFYYFIFSTAFLFTPKINYFFFWIYLFFSLSRIFNILHKNSIIFYFIYYFFYFFVVHESREFLEMKTEFNFYFF